MKFIEYVIEIPADAADANFSEIIIAELADFGFSSFSDQEGVLKAYVDTEMYHKELTESYLDGISVAYTSSPVKDQNWNEVWESNFEPVEIDDRVIIRAPYHTPSKSYDYTIRIMPKMSFGTGHHQTTHLMISEMLSMDFAGKSVLDMGSGTGVLAIFAAMLGARSSDAIDIDDWAYENCVENIAENEVQGITPILGDVALTEGRQYDIVLANINLNILLEDMPAYVKTMPAGGELLMSGILESDIPTIEHRAKSLGLNVVSVRTREGWGAVRCTK